MKKIISLFALALCFSFGLQAQELPKAKIVFLRTFNYFGGTIGFNVFNDTTKITRMKPQTFEVLEVDAKPIRLWARTEVKRHLDLDVKPNYIYFVRGRVSIGIFIGRPRIETMTVDEFRNLVSRKKYLQKQLKKAGFDNVHDFLRPYEAVNISGL